MFLGTLVCVPRIWEEILKPLKLKQVKAHKMRFVDEPSDGWPADCREMKDELVMRKAFSNDWAK